MIRHAGQSARSSSSPAPRAPRSPPRPRPPSPCVSSGGGGGGGIRGPSTYKGGKFLWPVAGGGSYISQYFHYGHYGDRHRRRLRRATVSRGRAGTVDLRRLEEQRRRLPGLDLAWQQHLHDLQPHVGDHGRGRPARRRGPAGRPDRHDRRRDRPALPLRGLDRPDLGGGHGSTRSPTSRRRATARPRRAAAAGAERQDAVGHRATMARHVSRPREDLGPRGRWRRRGRDVPAGGARPARRPRRRRRRPRRLDLLRVDAGQTTLRDFQHRHHFRATPGGAGTRARRHGKAGDDLVLDVPPGTAVYDDESGALIADLVAVGQVRWSPAAGGAVSATPTSRRRRTRPRSMPRRASPARSAGSASSCG